MASQLDRRETVEIVQTAPKALFSELVASALEEVGTQIRPLTRTYLVNLLDRQVCAVEVDLDDSASALVSLLEATRSVPGLGRIPELRELGDRALFVSGFFGGRRHERAAPRRCYSEIGRLAYEDISERLAGRVDEPTWVELFAELADRFEEFEELLAEVGEFARPDPSTELLKIYDRYVRTGSLRDRALLQRRGLQPPPRTAGLVC